jgi:hypothetical protein
MAFSLDFAFWLVTLCAMRFALCYFLHNRGGKDGRGRSSMPFVPPAFRGASFTGADRLSELLAEMEAEVV